MLLYHLDDCKSFPLPKSVCCLLISFNDYILKNIYFKALFDFFILHSLTLAHLGHIINQDVSGDLQILVTNENNCALSIPTLELVTISY